MMAGATVAVGRVAVAAAATSGARRGGPRHSAARGVVHAAPAAPGPSFSAAFQHHATISGEARGMCLRSHAAADSCASSPSPWLASPSGGLIHRDAAVDASVVIEPFAVIHAGAVIGPGCRIGTGAVVGPGVVIGAHTILWYHVSLRNCEIGSHCELHQGVAVGQDGFGFTVDAAGQMVKKPQELGVRIGDHVEIGANSCIDRGSWRETVIGDHTKLDNLVQVGHNVILGRCCLLCGAVAIGGSSTLGDYVVMGGKSAVADHITVVSKCRVAAKAGVTHDLKEPGDYGGFPAVAAALWRKELVLLRSQARRQLRERRGGAAAAAAEPRGADGDATEG